MKLHLVVGALALPACSVLYNPNNINDPKVDAAPDAPDAPTDAAIDAPDAPPDMELDAPFDAPTLTITATAPTLLPEGTGSGTSRPMLVIVTGTNLIAPTFVVDAIDDNGVPKTVQINSSRASSDGTKLVLALTIPVLTAAAQGQTKALHITASQFGFTAPIDLTIQGLDELSPTGNVDTGTLRTLYSRATFSQNVHFFGTAPALIRVTSDITISAVVDTDGSGLSPGANACSGGAGGGTLAAGNAGTCGTSGGGGGAGGSGTGGGGGGFGTAGGASGGAGGVVTGDPLLASLTSNTNRGNGGGGGGGATLGVGGAGGGGGGVLELTADGAITVSGAGKARARGADGGAGGALGGGAGGGGSGGAIVVRAGAGIAGIAGWVNATGGAGGGAGGAGRIRIDTPNAITGMASPAPVRGAAWATATPTIVGAAALDVGLVGDAAKTYGIYVNDIAQPNAVTDGAGAATVSVTLVEGVNKLCATVGPAVSLTTLESVRCIQIAYEP